MPTPENFKKKETQLSTKEKCDRMTYGPFGFFSQCSAHVRPGDDWADDDCREMARENLESCMQTLKSTNKPK